MREARALADKLGTVAFRCLKGAIEGAAFFGDHAVTPDFRCLKGAIEGRPEWLTKALGFLSMPQRSD